MSEKTKNSAYEEVRQNIERQVKNIRKSSKNKWPYYWYSMRQKFSQLFKYTAHSK